MEWAALGGMAAGLAGIITFALLALRAKDAAASAQVAAAKLDSQFQAIAVERSELVRKMGKLASDAEDTRARLEAVIAQRDARIAELEKQLDGVYQDLDPGLLGSSLVDIGLVRRPEAGTTAATRPEAASGLPASVAAALDAARGKPGGQ